MMEIPFFTIILVIGIIISAIMSIITGREERRQELTMIEQEGEIYMRRIEEEKKKKAAKQSYEQGET